jgi:hypothetical protein
MPWRVRVVIGIGARDAVDNRSCLREGSETALSQEFEGNMLDGVMCCTAGQLAVGSRGAKVVWRVRLIPGAQDWRRWQFARVFTGDKVRRKTRARLK